MSWHSWCRPGSAVLTISPRFGTALASSPAAPWKKERGRNTLNSTQRGFQAEGTISWLKVKCPSPDSKVGTPNSIPFPTPRLQALQIITFNFPYTPSLHSCQKIRAELTFKRAPTVSRPPRTAGI